MYVKLKITMNIENFIGLTLPEWKQAYQLNQFKISDLFEYIEHFSLDDTAWISLADQQNIQEQISIIQARVGQHSSPWDIMPLYGIPFAVKDNIDVKGFATTAACKALTEIKQQDAEVVRLLKEAGAVVVGKTNLDQFATGLVGTRSPFGAVQNTFNKDYVSGGSSSGSASVVARGLVPFALGTDTAGSGRVPAAFNNIVGLKPTKGRFSNRGLMPACKTLDCITVFALTVGDASTVAQIMEQFDDQDAYSRSNPKTAPARLSSKLHFAIPEHLNFYGDSQSEHAFQKTLEDLEHLGASFTKIDFKDFESLATQLYQGAWVAERTTALTQNLQAFESEFDPTVLKIVKQGHQFSAVDAYNAEYLCKDLAIKINKTLQQFDGLIVPTSPTIHTIAQMKEKPIEYNSQFGTYTNFTNLADLSALALPTGFRADGLPFGITVIAPKWYDDALIHFGKRLQQFLKLPLGALNKQGFFSYSDQVSDHYVKVAVVGAHLTDMPLNFQLTTRNAVLLETITTSKNYALYALNNTQPLKPALVRVDQNGVEIALEVWAIPKAHFGEFVAEIPTPLGIGSVELSNGRWVKGFICEPYGISDAQNISHFGGWRSYLNSKNQG